MSLNLIHTVIEEQASKSPDATAIEYDTTGASMTYAELSARSADIAKHICAATQSAQEQPLVAINTDRSLAMVAGMVGILKSGAGYVPIDPNYPLDRQQYIFSDSGCQALVTSERQADSSVVKSALADGITVIALDEAGNVVSTSCKAALVDPTGEQPETDLAYVLYTSGSTGKPKGVMVQHDNAMNMLQHFRDDLGVHNGTHSVLAVTTFCFDISVLEIFMTLTAGARMVLASSATQKDGFALLDLIEAHPALTVMQATPATYEMLHVCGFEGRDNLVALCGGEAFRPNLLKLKFKRFVNVYGPTETTVWSSSADVTAADAKCVPVGKPILNTTFRILDADNREVAQGESGEMWIGGAGVTRGYLHRPELTAEKFVTFAAFGGERLYRTGDVGYVNAAGDLVCQGRMDTQVKFRGYRIELGEIETAVCAAAPAVDVAIVVVRDDLPGGDALVAYVKLANSGMAMLDEQAVKAAMRASIPAYMVPKHFVLVDSFPMTPNLKVDRKQLPVPPAATATATATATTVAEAKVATDPAAPEMMPQKQQKQARKKRGFWRSLGRALATPYREVAEAADRIAAAEARDAAVQRVEEAVAALAGLDAAAAAGIDAASRRRIEAAAKQALAAVGSKKVVATAGAAAVQRPAGGAPAAPPAAVPVAAEDTSKLETEISDIVFNVTGTRLEGPDASMEMIGLDSLGSMLVVASLRKQLGVAVAPSSIKEHGNSLQDFAQHIRSCRM